MALGSIDVNVGGVVQALHHNSLADAMVVHWVPRNLAGIATDLAGSIGQPNLRWEYGYFGVGIFLDGILITADTFKSDKDTHRIDSGRIRSSESGQPDFLRANGTTFQATILGATTNLICTINNQSVLVNTDVTFGGLTAASSTSNTCLVNEPGVTAVEYSKHIGEQGGALNIDTAGTEITNRIGQFAAFSNGTEIFLAYIKSATQLTNCKRGWFFNSSGTPLVRNTFADNSTLTLLNLGWVFLENSSTIDVSYRTPIVSHAQPTGPLNGDYWYDLSVGRWKRYSSGSGAFSTVNRMPIGLVVTNTIACIATRSFDFYKTYSDYLNFDVQLGSTSTALTDRPDAEVNVYGSNIKIPFNFATWNIATDLETGFTEAANTTYYMYVTYQGRLRFSPERPQLYDFRRGWYHPYHAWRYVGQATNDGSSNFSTVQSFNLPGFSKLYEFATAGTFTFVTFPNILFYDIESQGGGAGGGTTNTAGSWGGGGGGGGYCKKKQTLELMRSICTVTVGTAGAGANSGGNNNGGGGGTSSLGGIVTSGGNGGQANGTGGSGGTAAGGDVNASGSQGGTGGAVQGIGGTSGSGSVYGKGGNGATIGQGGQNGGAGRCSITIST